MAKILTPISLSAQELIRDKIVQILALELPNQATLLNDQDVNAEVERERNTAIQFNEMPLINVALSRTDGQKQNQTVSTGSYYYDLDIYTKGLYDEDGDEVDGDELAAIKNQKIHRVVTGILSATVISYQPQRSQKIGDSENTDQARIQVQVNATEANITETALALIKSNTESTLGASGKKYVWVWDKVI